MSLYPVTAWSNINIVFEQDATNPSIVGPPSSVLPIPDLETNNGEDLLTYVLRYDCLMLN